MAERDLENVLPPIPLYHGPVLQAFDSLRPLALLENFVKAVRLTMEEVRARPSNAARRPSSTNSSSLPITLTNDQRRLAALLRCGLLVFLPPALSDVLALADLACVQGLLPPGSPYTDLPQDECSDFARALVQLAPVDAQVLRNVAASFVENRQFAPLGQAIYQVAARQDSSPPESRSAAQAAKTVLLPAAAQHRDISIHVESEPESSYANEIERLIKEGQLTPEEQRFAEALPSLLPKYEKRIREDSAMGRFPAEDPSDLIENLYGFWAEQVFVTRPYEDSLAELNASKFTPLLPTLIPLESATSFWEATDKRSRGLNKRYRVAFRGRFQRVPCR
jgi:hypothetical protein